MWSAPAALFFFKFLIAASISLKCWSSAILHLYALSYLSCSVRMANMNQHNKFHQSWSKCFEILRFYRFFQDSGHGTILDYKNYKRNYSWPNPEHIVASSWQIDVVTGRREASPVDIQWVSQSSIHCCWWSHGRLWHTGTCKHSSGHYRHSSVVSRRRMCRDGRRFYCCVDAHHHWYSQRTAARSVMTEISETPGAPTVACLQGVAKKHPATKISLLYLRPR